MEKEGAVITFSQMNAAAAKDTAFLLAYRVFIVFVAWDKATKLN